MILTRDRYANRKALSVYCVR